MIKNVITLLFICIPIFTLAQAKWDTIDRLKGTWQIGEQQVEVWTKETDYDMTGKGIQINREGEEVILEHLQIEGHPKGGIYYKATVPNQNEGKTISFVLKDWDKRNLIFENAKHDFPQKIHYNFRGKKRVKVHVSGSGRSFSLEMRKVSR